MGKYFKLVWEETTGNIELIVLLLVMWIVLFEQFSWLLLLVGFVVSVLVVLFTDRFLLKGNYEHSYIIRLSALIRYAFLLLVEIFKAGIGVIPVILSGKEDTQIVTYVTPLEDELLIDILANSITLTPGTVSVEKKGSELKILSISGVDDAREAIPAVLEDALLDYEKSVDGKA